MLERKEKGYKDLHLCLEDKKQHTEGQCLRDTNAGKRASSPVLYYKVGSFHTGANLDSHHTQTPLCGCEEQHSLGWLSQYNTSQKFLRSVETCERHFIIKEEDTVLSPGSCLFDSLLLLV